MRYPASKPYSRLSRCRVFLSALLLMVTTAPLQGAGSATQPVAPALPEKVREQLVAADIDPEQVALHYLYLPNLYLMRFYTILSSSATLLSLMLCIAVIPYWKGGRSRFGLTLRSAQGITAVAICYSLCTLRWLYTIYQGRKNPGVVALTEDAILILHPGAQSRLTRIAYKAITNLNREAKPDASIYQPLYDDGDLFDRDSIFTHLYKNKLVIAYQDQGQQSERFLLYQNYLEHLDALYDQLLTRWRNA